MTTLPEHLTNHAQLALARVLQQYKGRPKFEGQVEDHADQFQAAEDALWQLATDRYLDTSVGVHLDRLGSVLNEVRGPLTDAEYTLVLTAKIRLLRSSGTVPDVLAVFGCLLPGVPLTLTGRFPAGFTLEIGTTVDSWTQTLYRDFLRRAKAAGVWAYLLWNQDEDCLTLSDAAAYPETSTTTGLGDATDTAVGGHLTGAAS